MKSHRNDGEYTISVRDIVISWSLNANPTRARPYRNHSNSQREETLPQLFYDRSFVRRGDSTVALYNICFPPSLSLTLYSLSSLFLSIPFTPLSFSSLPICYSVFVFSHSFLRIFYIFSVFPFNSSRNVACVFSLIAWDAYARRYGTELLCLTKSITHYRCVHVYTRVRLGIRLLGSLCLYLSG